MNFVKAGAAPQAVLSNPGCQNKRVVDTRPGLFPPRGRGKTPSCFVPLSLAAGLVPVGHKHGHRHSHRQRHGRYRRPLTAVPSQSFEEFGVEEASASEVAEWESEKAIEAAEEAEERATDPEGPGELDLARLRIWARSNKLCKVHPAIVVQNSSLVVSAKIEKDSPLVGLMPEALLFAGEASENADKVAAALALAWRMLMERGLVKRTKLEAGPWPVQYLMALPRQPAQPVLWLQSLVAELQDAEMQKEVEALSACAHSWLSRRCERDGIDPKKLRKQFFQCFAAALGRATLVDGKWVLVPLVDSLDVPGISTNANRPVQANCRLELEDIGEGRQLLMLVTTRTIEEGELLVREVSAKASQMLLEYRTVIEDLGTETEISVKAYLTESAVPRVTAVQRTVKDAMPGRLFGDVIVKGLVRPFARFEGEGGTRMDDLAAAIGTTFLKTSLVLSVANLEEVETLEDEQVGDRFVALAGEEKRTCLQALLGLLQSCLGEFQTTVAEDERLQTSVKGCRLLAVAFRRQRKQALRQLVEEVKEAADKAQDSSGLPFAVMGKR